jgi:ribosomal protein L14
MSKSVFTCESCGAVALRSQREIDRDSGELVYEDLHCVVCQHEEERKITPDELVGLPVIGRIQ